MGSTLFLDSLFYFILFIYLFIVLQEEEKLELLVSPMRNLVDALWTMFDDHGLGDWK